MHLKVLFLWFVLNYQDLMKKIIEGENCENDREKKKAKNRLT